MKIKCVKLECFQCQKEGLAQMFLNNTGSIRYARVRHYSHNDATSHKPQFTYCKDFDPEKYRQYLFSKYSHVYAEIQFRYLLKYHQCYDQPIRAT